MAAYYKKERKTEAAIEIFLFSLVQDLLNIDGHATFPFSISFSFSFLLI